MNLASQTLDSVFCLLALTLVHTMQALSSGVSCSLGEIQLQVEFLSVGSLGSLGFGSEILDLLLDCDEDLSLGDLLFLDDDGSLLGETTGLASKWLEWLSLDTSDVDLDVDDGDLLLDLDAVVASDLGEVDGLGSLGLSCLCFLGVLLDVFVAARDDSLVDGELSTDGFGDGLSVDLLDDDMTFMMLLVVTMFSMMFFVSLMTMLTTAVSSFFHEEFIIQFVCPFEALFHATIIDMVAISGLDPMFDFFHPFLPATLFYNNEISCTLRKSSTD
jgi:hypothetical protein